MLKEEHEFEWDARKSRHNKKSHGVSFIEACAIWDDPCLVEMYLPSGGEKRWGVIGRVAKDKWLTAIITYRDDSIRIISCRRSTQKEIDYYGTH